MSTHNIHFQREIREYQYFFVEKSALSGTLSYDQALFLFMQMKNIITQLLSVNFVITMSRVKLKT